VDHGEWGWGPDGGWYWCGPPEVADLFDGELAQKVLPGANPPYVKIIAHAKFEKEAKAINATFSYVQVRLKSDVHSNVVLIEPDTVVAGSANFGDYPHHPSSLVDTRR
jgi:hypothetical protein